MNFWNNLHPLLKRDKSNYNTTNYAILSALADNLQDVEEDTVKKKIQMSLETATGDYLDTWGSWFNTFRRKDEDDDDYRARIIKYITMARSTIPAIIDGISDALLKEDASIAIYEPWRNIFTTDVSKLDGADHIEGYYYRFAVIDINMDIPISQAIKDAIEAFKPAGVKYYTTYPISEEARQNTALIARSDKTNYQGGVAVTKTTISLDTEVK